MASITAVQSRRTLVSWRDVLIVALAVGVLWLVAFEGGTVSTAIGQAQLFLHEVFHDARHLVGVPCH